MAAEVIFQPIGRRITAPPGATLLEAAQSAGVALSAVCGGIGVCGDCRVRIQRGAVTPINDVERDWLTDSERDGGLRLACQVSIAGEAEIVVDVPPDSLSAPQRSQVEGEEIPIPVIPVFSPGDDASGAFGFAVDVGTTGLAAYLVDLLTGKTLSIAGATNPQIAYGEDVMARLTLAMHRPGGAAQLQQAIIGGLNDLLRTVCAAAHVAAANVAQVVAVGNTAMHHLLLGLPLDQLGSAPYIPAVSSAVHTPARVLGLDVAEGASLYLPPNIAGFVGGDHVAMLLATATPDQPGVTLSLDIGTNTEVTLNAQGRLWCCSTASGPAFEGAHIRDGMRAAAGAIERLIWRNSGLAWQTIHHAPPVGLCGSGILDAVATLRAAGILTPTGAMRPGHPQVHGDGHDRHYEIVPAERTGHGRAVTLSRADVNEVQLAKAAIRAGIKLLVEQANLTEQDIDRVIIAGAFGNYLDLDSAITVGLFPPLPRERFRQVGNAAGMGAKRLLINAPERQRADELAQRLTYIELTNHPRFADRFAQAVRLTPDPWDE
jgi:uncharacterized 2Fe-2S/4Fe-4S cluster protein (DUF4445 family)